MTPKKKTPRDLAKELMEFKPDNRLDAFRLIPEPEQGFVLLFLPKKVQKDIMHDLTEDELVQIIDYLDPDDATDLVQEMCPKKANRILSRLGKEIREKVEFLAKFDPRTAAGLMSLDYIEVQKGTKFEELARIIKKHERKTGRFPAILVVDKGLLVGEVPPHVLAIARKNEKIDKYVRRVPHILHNKSEKEILEAFKKHPHDKIVVLDSDKSILGVIYSDDILRLIEKQSTQSLRKFAGIREDEDVLDPTLTKVKYRYKWLIINLATAFLAAGVVGLFQDTISKLVILAVYMPIVAGMGGNAATQTLAVIVRGLALKEIDLKTAKPVILKEIGAGFMNGVINGVIVAAVATFVDYNPMLGLVTALAMIINLVIAGIAGSTIPLIMKRLGKDPASSATIFITTATDVGGFFSFLGLATLLML